MYYLHMLSRFSSSNLLLVVLCGDRNTQPVINTGTIYQ